MSTTLSEIEGTNFVPYFLRMFLQAAITFRRCVSDMLVESHNTNSPSPINFTKYGSGLHRLDPFEWFFWTISPLISSISHFKKLLRNKGTDKCGSICLQKF